MHKEPLWTVGAVTAIATAAVAALVAFGVPLSDDQRSALLGLVAVLAPLAVATVARGKVFTLAAVERIKAESAPPAE